MVKPQTAKPKARGIEIREAHFPGRAPIEAYGNGGFRFAGMSHRGSLLVLPSGIYGWNVETLSDCNEAAFQRLLEEAETVEVLLFGTGTDLQPIPRPLKAAFSAAGISADPMATGAAVRTLNVLLAEDRQVAAALLAV